MQIFHAMVMIAGDMTNVCFRGPDNPISYPEMIILGVLHGENAISEVVCVADEPRDSGQERLRLGEIYGEKIMASTFPGKWALLPEGDRRYKPPALPYTRPAQTEDAEPGDEDPDEPIEGALRPVVKPPLNGTPAGEDPRSPGALRKARAREKARQTEGASATVPPGQLPPTHIPGSGAPLPDIF